MRKKLTALISTLCIVSCLISVSSAAEFTDVADDKRSVAINTVCGLGIMEETEYGMFSPESCVTRGEAAAAVGKLFKYDWELDVETSFTDVPPGADEVGYINTLKSMGIMLGYTDTYFGYEEEVTLEQFETILLRATGYMALDGIMDRLQMLAKADFLEGITVSGSDKLTRADMAQLLYNCLETNEISVDHEGKYSADNTVLENRHGLRKITGVVTANSITRLSSRGGVGEGNVEIDSQNYGTVYTQADNLLGYPVVAYCETENDNIVYMHANPSKYTVTDVPDYDIVDIETDGSNVTVKYDYNSRMKMEVFDIDDNIIYNGTAISALTEQMLNINMGGIKIVELSSGVRNVFVESYVDYIVEYVNTDAKTIVDKLSRQIISLDFEDSIRFYKFGYETTFDQIKPGEVLSVYDNNDYDSRNIIVYISDDKETGKITGCAEDLVYINGKTYRRAAGVDFTEYIGNFDGTFYIDASGRIVGADKENNTGFRYGCLVKVMYDETLINSTNSEKSFLSFKILDSNGQITDYPASDKLRINEVKVYKDWENFPFDIFRKNGDYFNQLIKFQVNYEGKVTLIYTENQDSENSPQVKSDFAKYRYRSKSGGMFSSDTMLDTTNPGFFVDASTVIFSVPNEYTADAEDYKVISVSSFREMMTYNSKAYDVDEYSVAKALMVTASDTVADEVTIMGVNNVLNMVNSNGEIVQGVKVAGNNKIAEYEFNQRITTKVDAGDIIQINVDEKGRVNAVNVIENAEEITELVPDDDFHYDFAAGVVYGVSGDYLRLDFTNNTSMSFKLTNATQYCIYRKGSKQFEIADKNSIMVGKKALVQVLNGYASNVFVFE